MNVTLQELMTIGQAILDEQRERERDEQRLWEIERTEGIERQCQALRDAIKVSLPPALAYYVTWPEDIPPEGRYGFEMSLNVPGCSRIEFNLSGSQHGSKPGYQVYELARDIAINYRNYRFRVVEHEMARGYDDDSIQVYQVVEKSRGADDILLALALAAEDYRTLESLQAEVERRNREQDPIREQWQEQYRTRQQQEAETEQLLPFRLVALIEEIVNNRLSRRE